MSTVGTREVGAQPHQGKPVSGGLRTCWKGQGQAGPASWEPVATTQAGLVMPGRACGRGRKEGEKGLEEYQETGWTGER